MHYAKSLTYQNTFYLFRDNGQEVIIVVDDKLWNSFTSDLKLNHEETWLVRNKMCKRKLKKELKDI